MDILENIIRHKIQEVSRQEALLPLEELKGNIRSVPLTSFYGALSQEGVSVIAEVKRKSPSAGEIFSKADPIQTAVAYQQNGAAAVSVLTDEKFFGGNLDFLRQVKSAVNIPVLRKDFIVSPYQVYESYAAGADAILLIADALSFEKLNELYELAVSLGMDVLAEAFSDASMEKLRRLDPKIAGINCRDLKTMKTDLSRFQTMISQLPADSVKVAESGIRTHAGLTEVSRLGYDAALVGTSLMKDGTPGKSLRQLLGKYES